MKQIAILFSLLLALSTALYGQNLKFAEDSLDLFTVGPTGVDGSGEYKVGVKIINLDDEDRDVLATRLTNDLATGHGSYFCWDLCYDETVDQSGGPITIAAGDTTRTIEQYLTFLPNQIDGYSEVTMVFTDVVSGENLQRTYQFSVGGVLAIWDDLDLAQVLGAPYPNPAQSQTTLTYALPGGVKKAELRVINLIGKQVINQPLNLIQGRETLSLQAFSPGMYFVHLFVDGQSVVSRKLIVNK